jgi:hypothetical protein
MKSDKKMIKELSDLCNVRIKKIAENSGQDLLHTMVFFIKAYNKYESRETKKLDVYSLNLPQSVDIAMHTLDVMDRLYSRKYGYDCSEWRW